MVNIVADFLFLIVLVICVIVKLKEGKEELTDPNEKTKKYGHILFMIMMVITTISLCYKVTEVPEGLHVDEAGALYDAICLSKYGVDRYLYKLPVYFINFGGGQNALYTYLAAIVIKLFGASTLSFRLPAIAVSLISMLCLYKMIVENNEKGQALFTTFILAVCPWFIMKSRWGLESYLMCSMLTISTFVFVKALNFNKIYWYILAGILFGLTLYTYAIAYLVVPAVVGITLLYCLAIKKTNIKNIVFLGIPLGIFAMPLILMLTKNSGMMPNVKIPIFSIPQLWFFRGGEISLKNIPENLKNIFDILFIKDFLNYNAIPEFGTLYKLSIPLVTFGLIEVIRNVVKDARQRKFTLDFMMLITFMIVLFVGLCTAELNINKINAIYIPMIYFAGRFLMYIAKNSKYLAIVMLALYGISYSIFMNDYFTTFAKTDLMLFENDIIEASTKAEELSKKKIYVENALNQTYIYTLIATPISPYEFNENLHISNGIVTQYGKYKFEIPQEIDQNAVYIIKNNQNKINELTQNGFQYETYGEFTVLYK